MIVAKLDETVANYSYIMSADWYKDFHFQIRGSWGTKPGKKIRLRTLGQDKTNRASKKTLMEIDKTERIEQYQAIYASGFYPLSGHPVKVKEETV